MADPVFDPSAPSEEITSTPRFDPNLPSQEVRVDRLARKAAMQKQMGVLRAEGEANTPPWYLSDPVHGLVAGLTIVEPLKLMQQKIGEGVSYGLNKALNATGSPSLYAAGRPTLQVPWAHPELESPAPAHPNAIKVAIGRAIEGLTTPEGMATLPLLGAEGAVGKATLGGMALQQAQGVGQSVERAFDPNTPEFERYTSGVDAIINALMGGVMAKHAATVPEVPRSGLTPDDVQGLPGPRWEDLGPDTIGPDRQLPLRTYQAPSVTAPVGAARFVQDEMGRTFDVGQKPIVEQLDTLRDLPPYVERSTVVRPAQEPPVIIGGEKLPIIRRVDVEPGKEPVFDPNLPSKVVEDYQGGRVSFSGEAGGIPNARQLAIEPREEVASAESLRSNEGPVRETGSLPEGRQDQGGQDLQRPPQEGTETGNPEGSIGAGIQRAIEKNKEGGYGISPTEIFRDLFEKVRDTSKSLPGGIQRFKDAASEKLEATTPYGAGRIPGIRRLLDPRGYKTEPVDQALLTHQHMVNKGSEMTALWLKTREGVDRAFVTNKDGTVDLAGGEKGHLSDVIEAEMAKPGSQNLTPAQRKFVGWWTRQWKTISEMLREEGIKYFDDEGDVAKVGESYFPRPTIGKEGVEKTESPGTGGGKPFMMQTRKFRTDETMGGEAKGVAAKYRYEPDPFNRVARFLNGAYRAIADQRLANDPALKPKGDLLHSSPAFLTEGTINRGVFHGKIFDAETARKVNEYYSQHSPNWLKAVTTVNDNLKAVKFAADVGYLTNQGLVLMGAKPTAWARAAVNSFQALLDPFTLRKYLSKPENLQAAQEITANGGSVAFLPEFFEAAGKGRLLHNVLPIKMAERAMGVFLNVGKIELYKAFKPLAEEKGWSKAELAEALDNTLLLGRSRSIGVSQGRVIGERLLANAPSFLRGAANMLAMAGQGGVSGYVARRALGGMTLAITAQYMAYYAYQVGQGNMTWDDVRKRMTPTNPQFLKAPLVLPNGKRMEVSYSNIYISLAKLLAATVNVASGKKDLGTGDQNPFVRFINARKSPLADLAFQLSTGKDYQGNPQGILETGLKAVLPLSAEAATEGQSGQERVAGAASSFTGLNANPESFGAKRGRLLDEQARQRGAADYNLLGVGQRMKAGRAVDKELISEGGKRTSAQILAALQSTQQNGERVQGSLPDPLKEKLKASNLTVPGYDNSKQLGKTQIRLSDDEQEQLFHFQLEETQKRLNNIMVKNPGWDDLPANKKAARFKAAMEAAHTVAWAHMLREINASSRAARQSQPLQ